MHPRCHLSQVRWFCKGSVVQAEGTCVPAQRYSVYTINAATGQYVYIRKGDIYDASVYRSTTCLQAGCAPASRPSGTYIGQLSRRDEFPGKQCFSTNLSHTIIMRNIYAECMNLVHRSMLTGGVRTCQQTQWNVSVWR